MLNDVDPRCLEAVRMLEDVIKTYKIQEIKEALVRKIAIEIRKSTMLEITRMRNLHIYYRLLKQIEQKEQKKADYELAMKVSRIITKKRLLEK